MYEEASKEVWCDSKKVMNVLEGREGLEVMGGLNVAQSKKRCGKCM